MMSEPFVFRLQKEEAFEALLGVLLVGFAGAFDLVDQFELVIWVRARGTTVRGALFGGFLYDSSGILVGHFLSIC